MDPIAVIGSLGGLAFVSGIRLYSTILAAGLGIRFGYLKVPPQLADLEILARTPVLLLTGIVFLVEFFADKVPWVDTLWDSIHTFIRPIGAGVIAAMALGDVDPAIKVGAALLGGTVALSSHSAKAGTRLLANHSPEPFTNAGLSLAEDVVVVGGVWLAFTHPVAALMIVAVCLGLIVWLVPKLFRMLKREGMMIRDFLRGSTSRLAAARPTTDLAPDQRTRVP